MLHCSTCSDKLKILTYMTPIILMRIAAYYILENYII